MMFEMNIQLIIDHYSIIKNDLNLDNCQNHGVLWLNIFIYYWNKYNL